MLSLSFFFAMDGQNWWFKYNFLSSSSVCDWNDNATAGSFCLDDGTATVRELSLYENNLRYRIPTEIGHLSNLKVLYLDGNAISGSLPVAASLLSGLEVLTIDFNLLTSTIPSQYGQLGALQILRLNDNRLTGSIPSEIGQLEVLQELSLQNNELSSTVPSELANLKNWEFIYLENNSLRGNLDPVFCPFDGPNIDLWADCGFGLEITCSCCTFCCYPLVSGNPNLGCYEN
mmetsp:Transcript_11564/g.20773  ORF Transcript_11564/g.20773 Transcript_11564/m.20773 type:complete len:231 (-) Transcript_11564:508-1200(-)